MKLPNIPLFAILTILSLSWSACSDSQQQNNANHSTDSTPQNKASGEVDLSAPEWAKNTNIYEVNLRQYTEEGTINAFRKHLPRLKDMGVDILWFMPVHPISDAKKKGTLGSYYAVSDYKAVNPEFGTEEDFKAMVKEIHRMGMYILIDWVPNHTGWDHVWIKSNPEYYTQKNGEIIDPIDYNTGESWGWTDVADLNYDNMEMRKAMIDALEYWVRDMDIDGYRVDVAHGVPPDFFVTASKAIHKIKKVFMLAEAEVPELRNSGAFVMDYAWSLHHLMNEIAKEEKNAGDIDAYLAKDAKEFKKGYHMHFTTNHDENSWSGTEFERMGDGHKTFAVLAHTMEGMPLIYSGQEEPLKRRLEFFEKDPIGFENFAYADFYRVLLNLKKKNKALWNGTYGGKLQRLKTGNDQHVFAYGREKDGDKVLVILNLTPDLQDIELQAGKFAGTYNNVFAESTQQIINPMKFKLNPWDYIVLSNK